MLAFDDLFWKIVKLEENLTLPLSFRAEGALSAPMITISKGNLSNIDWNHERLVLCVYEILARCQITTEKISIEINGLDDNQRVIENFYTQLKDEYPNAVTNIWRERLLTSILKKVYCISERIIRERIDIHDCGGYQVGNKSFYELALEYIDNLRQYRTAS